jgi:hypothetical protein
VGYLNVFMTLMAVFTAVSVIMAICTGDHAGLRASNLLELGYTVIRGERNSKHPFTHPVAWLMHVAYGVAIAQWYATTNPTSDNCFVCWLLTILAAGAYIVTFLVRVYIVHKCLEYSSAQLTQALAKLDQHCPVPRR